MNRIILCSLKITHFIVRLLLCYVILLAGETKAQQVTYIGRPVHDTITNGETISIYDTSYAIAIANSTLEQLHHSRNRISFYLDENSIKQIPGPFTAKLYIKYTLTAYSGDSNSVPVADTLTIQYDTAGNYYPVAYRTFDVIKRCEIKIDSLVIVNGFTDIKKLLLFTNEISSFKTLIWDDCANFSINTLFVPTNPIDNNSIDTLAVNWIIANPSMVTEYDLEWTWVDSSALSYRVVANKPHAVFKHNATRVTLFESNYNIPIIYDGGGMLFYRVRPIKLKPNGQRTEGRWSTPGAVSLAGFQRNLNWQSAASYAEEGKRKIVVSYFDGSFRTRQTVTKDNTTNQSIVAETIYDFQGRPSIQVLPAPTLSSLLSYTPNFSLNSLNNAAYDRNNFDTLINGQAICLKAAESMGENSGAAKYYSTQNTEAGTGMNQFIPKAFGFPFTQTVYSLDNTGRIASQGGVGPDHRIGLHDTRYYYGKPSQDELYALFGTEVGNASHYQKNMVRDANGQYSVSYVDMHGRTIATALAGTTPKLDTTNRNALNPLESNVGYYVTENLLGPGTQQVEDFSIILTKGLVVPVRGDYTLEYALKPPLLQLLNCNADTICYDCLYDFNISVVNDCGDVVLDSTLEKIGVDTLHGIKGIDSLANAVLFAFEHTMELEEGAYTITKTLSIREDSYQLYFDSVFTLQNTCKTFEDFLKEEITAVLDSVSCSIESCESCISSLGTFEQFRQNYYTSVGIPINADTTNFSPEVHMAWAKALENCSSYCQEMAMDNLNVIRREMLGDMVPITGQYGHNEPANTHFSIFKLDGTTAYYSTLEDYTNILGYPAYVTNDAGLQKKPGELTESEFIRYFETTWADTLLQLHPEYARLKEAERLQPSYRFDEDVKSVKSFRAAMHAGYIHNILNLDPATRNTALLPTSFKDSLVDRLQNPGWSGSEIISIWKLASVEAHCPEWVNNPACETNYLNGNSFVEGALDTTNLCDSQKDILWNTFIQYYLQAKEQLIFQRIIASTPTLTTSEIGDLRFVSPDTTYFSELMGGVTDETTGNQHLHSLLYAQIDSSCNGYVDTWLLQLGACQLNVAQKDSLRDILLDVCRRGGDINHPAGASSVAPDSVIENKPSDFIEAVGNFYTNHNLVADTLTCNGYLIANTPAPYKANAITQVSIPYLGGALDSCACGNLNGMLQNWYYSDSAGEKPSFAGYLAMRYQSSLTDQEVNKLLAICQKGSAANCDTLDGAIIQIPPFIGQCGTTNTCADCGTIEALHNAFTSEYNFIIKPETYDSVTLEPIDTLQLAKNLLYEQYMNFHTGFSYHYITYLDFINTCDSVAECIFQDTAVAAFRKTYNRPYLYKPNAAGCNAAHWRSNYGGGTIDVVPLSSLMTNSQYVPLIGNAQNYTQNSYATIEYYDTLCFKPFSLEARMKMPKTGHAYNQWQWDPFNVYTLLNRFYFNLTGNPNSNFFNIPIVFEGRPNQNNNIFLNSNLVGSTSPDVLENWFNYKVDFTYDSVILYIDSQRIQAQYHAPFETFNGFYFNPYFGSYRIDWIRLRDSTGQEILFEDFDKPCNQISQIIKELCQPSCDSAWALYNGDTISGCTLNPCTPYSISHNLPKLCGGANETFTQLNYIAPPTCADSIDLAIQKATLRYQFYKDSITNIFDTAYRAKCLKAIDYESFTLKRPQREYHYTLYYYDQAGNLVKTVSPKGVDGFRNGRTNIFYTDSIGPTLDSLVTLVKAAINTGNTYPFTYGFTTQYRYNSLNQVIAQFTPDAGQSNFWYDTLGRLAISQNARQKLDSQYSYTLYDFLGRIGEVGQKQHTDTMNNSISRSPAALKEWLNTNNSLLPRQQITRTGYDFVSRPFGSADRFQQSFLRSRVSFSLFQDADNAQLASVTLKSQQPGTAYAQATYYSYDVHGNVYQLMQHYKQGGLYTVNEGANQYKIIHYGYDLISGKVNAVSYQPSYRVDDVVIAPADRYYHRYRYDAENRLTEVWVSQDSVYWEKDAAYQYYRHGPLARTELGQNKIQGLDYAYTLQGWLKGVNSTGLRRNGGNDDMGKDATPTASSSPGPGDNSLFADDAYGFALYYNSNDYTHIGSSGVRPFTGIDKKIVPTADTVHFYPLYNGNIAAVINNLPMFTAPVHVARTNTMFGMLYNYDQLNRIKGTRTFPVIRPADNYLKWQTISYFNETFSYDANGNITVAIRRGLTSTTAHTVMDDQRYNYYGNNNRLSFVRDNAASGTFNSDIDHQQNQNYKYDAIGNLVSDSAEGITRITWTVYGKIDSIYKGGTVISYRYDAGGNRILKKVNNAETVYVRDASGNVMSTYTNDSAGLWQREINLYGSSRVAVHNYTVNLSDPVPIPLINVGANVGKKYIFERGNKFFELSNHLGNVLVVVSDRKTSLANTGNASLVSRYRPVIVSAQDYYAFGMIMPQRSTSSGSYRYGFNGKENDNEISSTGNQYDYGFRIYNPRLGRFLSTDPLFKSYPELTPYQFASNTPIKAIDLDGLEAKKPDISFGDHAKLGLAYLYYKIGEIGNQMQERDGLERGKNSSGFAYAVENIGNQLLIVHGHLEMQQAATSGPKGRPTASSTIRTQGEVFSTSKLPSQIYSSFWSLNKGSLIVKQEEGIKPFVLLNVIDDGVDDVIRDANNIIVGRASLSAGEANLWIRTKGTTLEGRGADVFGSLVKKLEEYDEVKSIAGTWSKGEMGDNLKTFSKLLSENKSTKDAAFGTFTGKVAKRLGYTEVSVSSIYKDSDGNITNVNLSFYKPRGK